MPDIFFCADTHFHHPGIVEFTRKDGGKLRPWDNMEEHDEALIANWNNVVRPNDRVYLLGDFCIRRTALATIPRRLNGRIVLIAGNHDVWSAKDLLDAGFDDVRGYKVFENRRWICSHIPLSINSLERWHLNIHGHLHYQEEMHMQYKQWIEKAPHPNYPPYLVDTFKSTAEKVPNPKYICVSMEHINYTPISLSQVEERVKERVEKYS